MSAYEVAEVAAEYSPPLYVPPLGERPPESLDERIAGTRALVEQCERAGFRPHFVLTRADEPKRPFWRGHRRRYPSTAQTLEHVSGGGHIGLYPGSIDSVVVDADREPKSAFNSVMACTLPWGALPTTRGLHLLIRTDGGFVRSTTWLHGDFIGSTKIFLVRSPMSLARIVMRVKHAPVHPVSDLVQLSLFPNLNRRAQRGGSGATSKRGAERGERRERRRVSTDELTAALSNAGGIPVGFRSNALYYLVLREPGVSPANALSTAHRINRERMSVPLSRAEVEASARSARSRLLMWRSAAYRKTASAAGGRSGAVRKERAGIRAANIRAAFLSEPRISRRALADRFNCSEATVKNALSTTERTARERARKLQRKQIQEEHDRNPGISLRALAERCGCSMSTANRALKERPQDGTE